MKERSTPSQSTAPPRSALALFLLIFFTIYGGEHLYLYLRYVNAFDAGSQLAACLIVWMALMVIAPPAVRVLERSGFEHAARVCAAVGYVWMGFVFLSFTSFLVLDMLKFLLGAAGVSLGGAAVERLFSEPAVTAGVSNIAAACVLYGMARADAVHPRHLTMETTKRGREEGALTIVQISDLHLGIMAGTRLTRRLVSIINGYSPDIVVCTGDLVDGEIRIHMEEAARLLAGVRPRYGKFLVPGNHEYFAGIERAQRFAAASGFRVIRGETLVIPGVMIITAVDDPTGRFYGRSVHATEEELLPYPPDALFTLLLKHQPDVSNAACGRFDLQLSGHTHGGQIFPFGLLTRIRYRYHAGLFELSRGSRIYVSRGAGTWGPPMRLGAPPEVTVIRVVPGE